MILKAINSTASLIMLIVIGYILGGTKSIKEYHGEVVFSNFLANCALPCFVFYNIYSSFNSSEDLYSLMKSLPVPFLVIIVMLVTGSAGARLLHINPKRRGAYTDANAFANTSFIGFPLITSLLGAHTLPTGMLYYIANTLLFFTVGTWLLSRDAGKTERILTKDGIKSIFSPMLLGLIAAIAVKMLSLTIPDFALTSLSYFSSVCPCLGMIFAGILIRKNKIAKEYFFPEILSLLFLRYLVTPFIIGLLLFFLDLESEVKAVFYLLALLPSITQMSIMSDVIGSDSTFCALWLTVSSVVGVAYIPVIVYLAENVFHFI